LVAAHVICVMKLVYGLNDIPYAVDVHKTEPQLIGEGVERKLKEEKSEMMGIYKKLPSLVSVFSGFVQRIQQKGMTTQEDNIGNVEKYLNHMSHCMEKACDKRLMTEVKGENNKIKGFSVKSTENSVKNEFLVEEIKHILGENAEIPLPCCDFWVQKKKKKIKQYPFDYLFAIHCVSSLCGNMSTKEIHFICDRIDRFINGQNQIT
jgi:hypothetical protein